ncbi:hypothetical protein AUN10_09530 [Cronobacter sakazakii]|nr:hypothetical protein AUN10_09530 [Cronobacter sakazakii]
MSEISEATMQKAAEMESENDLVTIPRGLPGAALAVIKRPELDSSHVIELLRYYAYTEKAPGALRERAEPVGYRYRFRPTSEAAGKWILVETIEEANPLPKYEVQPLYTAPPAPERDCAGIDPDMSNAACLREINEVLGMNDITTFSQVATAINDMKSGLLEKLRIAESDRDKNGWYVHECARLEGELERTAPPARVVPKIDRKAICNKAHWLCARSSGATFYNAAEYALDEVAELLAPPAPVVTDAATAIRACLEEFPESVHDIVEECAAIAENACRAAMLQPVSQPYKLPEA